MRSRPVHAIVLLSLVAACGTAFEAGSGSGQDAATGEDSPIIQGGGDSGGGGDTSPGNDGSSGDAGKDGTVTGDTGAPLEGGPADTGSGHDAAPESGPEGGCPVNEACVPAAPPGWLGPVAFYLGAAPAPSCPPTTSAALTGQAGLDAPPAQCSTCACTGSVTCSAPEVQFSTTSTCNSSCATGTATSTCSALSGTCTGGAPTIEIYASAQSQPSASGCVASTETPTLPPVSWSQVAALCASASYPSCGSTQVCAPITASPFQGCIYQAGNQTCPNGPYSVKQVVYSSDTDTRGCSPCTCGLPTGTTCSGGSVGFANSAAVGCSSSGNVAVPSTCADVGLLAPPGKIELTTAPTPTSAGCTASGGTANGGVTATGPTTICCPQ